MATKMSKKKPAKGKKQPPQKEYTEEEKARFAVYHQRSQKKPIKFKSNKSKEGEPTIALQHPDDPLLSVKTLEALGTPDPDLQTHLLDQVLQTFKGTISADGTDYDRLVHASNYAMAILNGIQPQDEIEGMLAIQMIGVHNMGMKAMGGAMLGGQTFEGKKANVSYATKMLRTFMMQMEALSKYRTGGQQKMVVGSVSVSEGGQAIVGTVNQKIDRSGRE
ncbi:MAG: hypothetical protein ACYS0C_01785 [Planctomycetota bacterium]|jgi:hypothetical protein